MFKYTLSYFILAAVSGGLGFLVFTGVGEAIAKIFFATFLALFLGSLLYDPRRRRSEI